MALRHLSCVVAIALVGSLAAGCLGAPESKESDEDIGTAQQLDCTTDTPAVTNATAGLFTCSSGRYASPNASYGSATCAHEFVVEYSNNIGGAHLQATVEWDDALNPGGSGCDQATLNMTAYTYNGTSWSTAGSTSMHGSYDIFTSTCTFVYSSGYSAINLPSSGITKVRLAAEAHYPLPLTYKKVGTRLIHVNPC